MSAAHLGLHKASPGDLTLFGGNSWILTGHPKPDDFYETQSRSEHAAFPITPPIGCGQRMGLAKTNSIVRSVGYESHLANDVLP